MVEYLGVQIEPCGRTVMETPDSYWFHSTSGELESTAIPRHYCGVTVCKPIITKLCSTCLRKLGVLW